MITYNYYNYIIYNILLILYCIIAFKKIEKKRHFNNSSLLGQYLASTIFKKIYN